MVWRSLIVAAALERKKHRWIPRSARPAAITGAIAIFAAVMTLGADAGVVPLLNAAPRLEITDPWVRSGENLRVWIACAPGTGAGDIRSAVITYTALDPQAGSGWWFASPTIAKAARPGHYGLTGRCTPGPGSPYASGTATFRVATSPELWSAVSRTAVSITGDARFASRTIAFTGGSRLRIRYLRDVAGSVSVLGRSAPDAHASLYRVLSPADLRMRSGNRFCGQTPTFVTVLRTFAGVILTVYSGPLAPTGAASDAICASYTYESRSL